VSLAAVAAVALAIAALLAAGCSSGDDEQPPVIEGEGGEGQLENPDAGDDPVTPPETVAGLPDPCRLVPGEEVADVTRQDVVTSTLAPLSPTSIVCDHVVDEAGSVGTAIGLMTEGADEDLELHTSVQDATAVDGLGDEATWSETLGTLAVLQDGTLLTVNRLVVDEDPDVLRAQAEQMARSALEGLGAG
jgi:hypothetical protein